MPLQNYFLQLESPQINARLKEWLADEMYLRSRKPTKKEKEAKIQAGKQKRADQIKTNGGSHTYAQAEELLLAQNHKCAYCLCDLKISAKQKDHIYPVAKGGTNDISNIQWLCVPCNGRKSDSWPPRRSPHWLTFKAS